MANSKALFKQADLTRLVKALKAAGLEDFRIELDSTGKMTVSTVREPDSEAILNDWDAA